MLFDQAFAPCEEDQEWGEELPDRASLDDQPLEPDLFKSKADGVAYCRFGTGFLGGDGLSPLTACGSSLRVTLTAASLRNSSVGNVQGDEGAANRQMGVFRPTLSTAAVPAPALKLRQIRFRTAKRSLAERRRIT